jgi:biopolymer transport protein ExbD
MMRLPSARTVPTSDWVLQLINIVFLLLLFFLANGTILGHQELGIEPPQSALSKAGAPPRDAIYIDADGQMKFRGQALDAPAIAAALKLEPMLDPAAIQVVADRRLKAILLVDRLLALKRNGLRGASLLTIRDETQ